VHRIAEARGVLLVASLAAGRSSRSPRGVSHSARAVDDGVELILAHRVLAPAPLVGGRRYPGGCARLLSQTSNEVRRVRRLAGAYLGRPATPPVVLGLEAAWTALTDKARLAEEIEALAPLERKLLQAVEGRRR